MSLSIRTRLAAWNSVVFCALLALFASAFYLLHSRSRIAQLDDELARAAGLTHRLLAVDLDEGQLLAAAAVDAMDDIELAGLSLAIFDTQGHPLVGQWTGLPPPSTVDRPNPSVTTVATPSGPMRVREERGTHRGVAYRVGAAASLAPLERELAPLRRALILSVLLTVLLAVASGWLVARGALRPVRAMASAAAHISARTPGVRLASPHPRDELGRLARAFNELLERLERALAQQRQFMADASHELRTPVSIARTTLEVTLGRAGRSEAEYRDALGVVHVQMRRLTRIVEDLFTLARADAAALPLERRLLYVDDIVADSASEMQPLAGPRGVTLDWSGPGEVEAHADERLLRRLLANLVDNAIRHTPRGGRVRIQLSADDTTLVLAVSDSGSGIGEADRERVFERFVRLDNARAAGDGAGLGLPIARAIAEAHGGTLALAHSDASGSTFVARLPRDSGRA